MRRPVVLLVVIAALGACTAADDGAAWPFEPASVAGIELVLVGVVMPHAAYDTALAATVLDAVRADPLALAESCAD